MKEIMDLEMPSCGQSLEAEGNSRLHSLSLLHTYQAFMALLVGLGVACGSFIVEIKLGKAFSDF